MKIFANWKYAFASAILVVGSLFPIAKLNAFASVGATHDMADSASYNIRFKGAAVADKLGRMDSISVADIDGDGIKDFIVGAERADNNGRTDSGSLYYINGTLYNKITGTGKDVELSDPSNYTIRYDGSTVNGRFGYGPAFIADVDSNGKPDIVVDGFNENPNGRSASGSLYVILDSLIDDYHGTGNNVDMAISTNWNMRFDGASAGDCFGDYSKVADLNNNGKNDLIMNSTEAYYNNGRSGAVWIVYDSLLSGYAGVGQTIDMSDPSKYNLRYDGASDGDGLGDPDINVADVNSDGKLDLMFGAVGASIASRSQSGAVYVIYNALINSHSGVGQNIDLNNSANYSILYYGSAGEKLSVSPTVIGDMDGDGKADLVLGGQQSDYNSKANSGSIYVVYSSLIGKYSGPGQMIDMTNPDNYNIRIDGSAEMDSLSYHYVALVDVNNDGILDVVSSTFSSSHNSRQYSGSLYVFYGSMLATYSGTGNNIYADSVYSVRYDGATDNQFFPGGDNMRFEDINGDGQPDILAGAAYGYGADSQLRDAGAVYLIYNFPHTITMDSNIFYATDTTPKITGTVSAPNSTTNIAMVQYSVGSNAYSANWSNCTPADGAFNSTSERFSCTIPTSLSDSSKTVYVRAYDSNGSYTARSHYASSTLSVSTSTSSQSSTTSSTGTLTVLPVTGGDSTP
jgi:hypothetical protein